MSLKGFELLLSTLCLNASICHDIDGQRLQPNKLDHPSREGTLDGKHIKIGFINVSISRFTKENGTIIMESGLILEVVRMLQRVLNFTFDISIPKESTWLGRKYNLNGTIMGLLHNNEVDFAACFLPDLAENYEIANFSPSLYEGTWVMVLKRATSSATGTGVFAPFQESVWYIVLLISLVIGPCITLISYVQRRLFTSYTDIAIIDLQQSVLCAVRSTLKQGSFVVTRSDSIRVLLISWWLYLMILTAFYTGNLTAFLTLSRFTIEITETKDLLRKNYRWVTTENAVISSFIENPDDDLNYLQNMVNNGLGEYTSNIDDDSLMKELDAGKVMIFEKRRVENFMLTSYRKRERQGVPEEGRCQYVVVPSKVKTVMLGFAYPLKDPKNIQKLLNKWLRRIFESGVLSHFSSLLQPQATVCPVDLKNKDRVLRTNDFQMTFVLWSAGLVAATAVFIVELITPTLKPQKRKRKRKTRLRCAELFENCSRPGQLNRASTIFWLAPKFQELESSSRQMINGREYIVIKTIGGDVRLIPIKVPSAYLFRTR